MIVLGEFLHCLHQHLNISPAPLQVHISVVSQMNNLLATAPTAATILASASVSSAFNYQDRAASNIRSLRSAASGGRRAFDAPPHVPHVLVRGGGTVGSSSPLGMGRGGANGSGTSSSLVCVIPMGFYGIGCFINLPESSICI